MGKSGCLSSRKREACQIIEDLGWHSGSTIEQLDHAQGPCISHSVHVYLMYASNASALLSTLTAWRSNMTDKAYVTERKPSSDDKKKRVALARRLWKIAGAEARAKGKTSTIYGLRRKQS